MRAKFKREELNALKVGRPCEWRNGRWWKEGQVISEPKTDSHECQYILVRNGGSRTSTVSPGEEVRCYPNFIRARV